MRRLKNIHAVANEWGDICSSSKFLFLFREFEDAETQKDHLEKMNHREYCVKKVFIEEMEEETDER